VIRRIKELRAIGITGLRIPIATKLILSFLLIIALISAVFVVVGIRLIGERILEEAQEMVRHDLNAAREIYSGKLHQINDVIRFTSDRYFLKNALEVGEIKEHEVDALVNIKMDEDLDILTITDENGIVLLRTSNLDRFGDDQSDDELVNAVLRRKTPVKSTSIVSVGELEKESGFLAEQAYFEFIDTPMARTSAETFETDGMLLKAAAPIFDDREKLIGVIYGGVMLNRNYEIVDKIKQTIYEDMIYDGKDIGTATIFQDDVQISTNVKNEDGSRAIHTRVSEEVYNQVVLEGEPWIGRAYVVDNWYITAYEPIENINNEIIGILYVGILEQKYMDINNRAVVAFLAITLAGVLISMLLSYLVSRRISVPIMKLVSASREVAQGNLDARVEIRSSDELGEMAASFNAMASSLEQRDEQLKEFTRNKIMESERLALIGQLAANVAHELNNPLQGIVTYSHLLLEKMSCENSSSSSAQKIVTQANRCRDIIRGLLDFSRQRKPDMTVCNINSVLNECISLLENQANFQNIQINKDLEQGLPMIVVDPSQMQQVFINIIINAAEAMENGGQLTLKSRFNPTNEFIEIEIADTGHGIPEDDMEKLFDPFFTTKEVGHGTGLGLAISYGIIKEHRGSIFVESEVGKGTSFIMRLPKKVVEEIVNGTGEV
jgi:two-component system NtrC family sensor kinase